MHSFCFMITSAAGLRLLFYVEQDYSFDILRPLQTEARQRGHEVRWLVIEPADPRFLATDEHRAADVADAITYNPDLVFAPGDRVPAFLPGIKVQVFHGVSEEKRGNVYSERGLFDLYCTEGPRRSAMLEPLTHQRDYMRVAETGWLKLDTLFNYPAPDRLGDRPQVLYGSTFTPQLSSAELLYPEIKRLSRSPEWQWLVTLHPKMNAETVSRYRALENDNLTFFATNQTTRLQHQADVLICDNSSFLEEFLLLEKPVVTCRNRAPGPHLIDIREPAELEPAVRKALQPDDAHRQAIKNYAATITPWRDGRSATRVMDAAEQMREEGWVDRKPMNLWRNLKMRRQLHYYKFW